MFSRKHHETPNTSHGENVDPNTSFNDPNASYGTGSATTDSGRGPHKSSLLNKLDPRVDSTTGQKSSGTATHSDGGALGTSPRHGNPGYGTSDTGYGTSHTGHGDTTGYGPGNTGHGSGITGRNTGSTNAGPHDSNLANKVG
jgi:hypothetical protein